MYREKLKTNERLIVDSETGEILESVTESNHEIEEYRKCTQDEFIMVYLQDLSGFLKLDNGTQIKLLAIIGKEVKYNNPDIDEGNTLAILKDDKERGAKQLDVSTRTIDNALSALVKKNLLLTEARGKYKLNPKYYFKGSSKDRARILKMQITYDIQSDENDDLLDAVSR